MRFFFRWNEETSEIKADKSLKVMNASGMAVIFHKFNHILHLLPSPLPSNQSYKTLMNLSEYKIHHHNYAGIYNFVESNWASFCGRQDSMEDANIPTTICFPTTSIFIQFSLFHLSRNFLIAKCTLEVLEQFFLFRESMETQIKKSPMKSKSGKESFNENFLSVFVLSPSIMKIIIKNTPEAKRWNRGKLNCSHKLFFSR